MRHIFIFIFALVSLYGFGQTISLDSFVNNLSKKYHVKVSIDAQLLEGNTKVNVGNEDIYNSLKKSGIDYYLLNENFLLLRKAFIKETPKTKQIIGYVKDKETGEPLMFASIYTTDKSRGTTSDEHGKYTLEVPQYFDGVLLANYLGYAESQADQNGNFLLKQKPSTFEEVVIVATSIPNFDLLDVNKQLPNQVNYIYNKYNKDWVQNIQSNLSGVRKSTDSKLIIRNMKQDKTQTIIDNIPIMQSGHYLEVISLFNELYFNKATVYKSFYPLQYPGGNAGLVEFISNHDNNSTLKVKSNLLYTSIFAKTASDKFELKIGGRKSYLPINEAGFLEGNYFQAQNKTSSLRSNLPNIKFYDLNASAKVKISNSLNFELSGFKSNDENRLTSSFERVISQTNEKLVVNEFSESLKLVDQNGYSTKLGWQKKDLEVFFSISQFKQNDSFDIYINNTELRGNSKKIYDVKGSQNQEIINSNVCLYSTLKLASSQSISLGITSQNKENKLSLNEIGNNKLTLIQDVNQYSVFAQYISNKNNFDIDAGIRASGFSNLSGVYFEPHLLLKRSIQEHLTFRIGAAMKIQNQNLLDLESRFSQNFNYYYLANNEFPVQSSLQFSLGSNFKFKRINFDVEFYNYENDGSVLYTPSKNLPFRLERNLPIVELNNPYQFFIGKSHLKGIDFSVRYDHDNFQSIANYTLSKTTQQFKEIYRNQEILAPNDRRHTFSLTNNFKIKKPLYIGLNFFAMSGSPYVSSNLPGRDNFDKKNFRKQEVISFLPHFMSLDFTSNYELKFKKIGIDIGLNITNLTNRVNVKYIQETSVLTDLRGKQIVSQNQSLLLGRFVNLSLGFSL
jgi:hypothetical protein